MNKHAALHPPQAVMNFGFLCLFCKLSLRLGISSKNTKVFGIFFCTYKEKLPISPISPGLILMTGPCSKQKANLPQSMADLEIVKWDRRQFGVESVPVSSLSEHRKQKGFLFVALME